MLRQVWEVHNSVLKMICPLLLLAGCAVPPLDTPSGQPEIVLESVDRDCVKSTLVGLMLNQGFAMRSEGPSMIVGGRRSKSSTLNLLLSTPLSGSPEERLSFTFVSQGRALRVVASAQIVGNPGTAYEHIIVVSPDRAAQDNLVYGGELLQRECGNAAP